MPPLNNQELADKTVEPEKLETTVDDRPERAERIDDKHRLRGHTHNIRSTIRDAVKAQRQAEPREPKSAAEKANEPENRGEKSASPTAGKVSESKTEEPASGEPPQPASKIAAPSTAPKEVHAIWDKLPQEAQSIFAKREADMLKGVEQLKAKYKPIEDAFSPYQSQLRQLGKTEADAAKQLMEWQNALANPRTQAQAFQALAQAHGFNIQSLIAPQGAEGSQSNQQADPTAAFRPLIDPLQQRLAGLETEFQRRDRERVNSDIVQMSNGKPHFDRVRVLMGQLINAGQVPGSNPKEVFDEAYARACRADPEVFALIQQEEQERRRPKARQRKKPRPKRLRTKPRPSANSASRKSLKHARQQPAPVPGHRQVWRSPRQTKASQSVKPFEKHSKAPRGPSKGTLKWHFQAYRKLSRPPSEIEPDSWRTTSHEITRLLGSLNTRGKVKTFSGGRTIVQELAYANNSTFNVGRLSPNRRSLISRL